MCIAIIIHVVYDRITVICFILGDTGSAWCTNDRFIFVSSTVEECKEGMHILKGQEHTKWWIILKSLSPDISRKNIKECQGRISRNVQ